MQAPLIGVNRLRLATDGQGVTTLVAFHGCPLRCQFCLNPHSLSPDARVREMTPLELMRILRRDELYFFATKGGPTFGGGEPLLRARFIKRLLDLGAKDWHITIETSLNVPLAQWQFLAPYIHEYIIDIKDVDAAVYSAYTGRDNSLVLSNLRWLVAQGKAEHILCRVPLIPSFNTQAHRLRSKQLLQSIGITRFDFFTYRTSQKSSSL